MAFRMHAGVCACCSRYREKHTVKFYSYTEVPNLHLLSVNGPRSADMPRHALTTQSGLCLQPAACRIDGADLIIALCDDCYKHLDKAQIPLTSLVYVDTGGIPKSPVPELNLAPLSLIEEQLLSFNRVIRMVYVFHPTPDGRSVRQYQMRGNVIAFLNAPVTDVMAAVPLPLDQVHEHMQVIFVTQCSNKQDMQKAFAKAKALVVRGPEIAKWAVHMHKVRPCAALQPPACHAIAAHCAVLPVAGAQAEATRRGSVAPVHGSRHCASDAAVETRSILSGR